jgi:NAD-dependent deacetylase
MKFIIFSGAGLSAESGVPTFRDKGGLWEEPNLINRVSTEPNWEYPENYGFMHEFHSKRRVGLGTVQPNAAHRMIAEWQKRYETIILTQNIDDLLERAGCTDVVHLHGHLDQMRCVACEDVWSIGYKPWMAETPCPKCKIVGSVRPNIVFFGGDAPFYRNMYRAIYALNDEDVILVTGTSGAVIPIEHMLEDRPGYKIFNALEATPLVGVYDRALLQPATKAFPIIDEILRERLG